MNTEDYIHKKGNESLICYERNVKLSEVGIEKEKSQAMEKGTVRYGNIGSIKPLAEQDVLNIFNMEF
ncbi:hypothetical protein [Clostridium sp. BSD9I1]|uniref:hypothetical protein n=1 Tax=Clostridium sp. BSD9I1 TaxID=2003589 RepID=UPI00164956B5|nr:hypothetical protein [Clostridium sp. BSD9I1]